jgi:sugar lactone lactonase YvrE
VDLAGNLYVADTDNNEIRKIAPGGAVTTLAGASNFGAADGPADVAQYRSPQGLALDDKGNIYVADTGSFTIRRVSPIAGGGWMTTTLAGLPGVSGSTDGAGSAARFVGPGGLAVDTTGDLYVTDAGTTVRKVSLAGTNWVVTTLAGQAGARGSADGTGSTARFFSASGVAVDQAGNIYVADSYNCTIRKVTSAGTVTTLAGSAGGGGNRNGAGATARFNGPLGLAVDSAGNIYATDPDNQSVRKITPLGEVTTLAGSTAYPGEPGSTDGIGTDARFFVPQAIGVDSMGNVYVAERLNRTIRKITPAGVVTTLAAYPNQNLLVASKHGLAVDKAGNIFIADLWNTIRKGSPAVQIIPEGPGLGFLNGQFSFEVVGPSGASVVVEASKDLAAWSPFSTNTLTGRVRVSDPATGGSNQRFYRIKRP